MKVYIVILYSEIVVGVYDSKDKANEAIANSEYPDEHTWVKEVELNAPITW